MKPITELVPHRGWAVFLLGLCLLVTAAFAVNIFAGRRDIPMWFWLLFEVSTILLLSVIVCYAVALLRHPPPESPRPCPASWIWFCLVTSVIGTSSLHGFFPFRPSVAVVWERLPPDLKLIKYNYVFTAGCLLVTVALAVLFFCRRHRLALVGLLLLSGVMLIPNNDCPNVLNLPWIAWIRTSPLMFLCNSVVVLVGYCALCGCWPRLSVLVMSGINVWVLVLGLGHTAQFDREVNRQTAERKLERQRQRPPVGGLNLLPIEGHASFYVCSDARLVFKEGLPVIICIGHPFQPPETLLQFVGKFSEPVLLIWSALLADLSADTMPEDAAVWEKKRREFAKVLGRYRELLRFDERRVYLTGFSFAGAYAWMLAYDRPDLYAGVVVMSAPSYPQPVQRRLDSGKTVVTVVVRGAKDAWFLKRRAQEEQTGQAIESLNPHSRFLSKPGATHRSVAKHWLENLNYILQFKRATPPSPDQPPVTPSGSGASSGGYGIMTAYKYFDFAVDNAF
jgi:predicted esterase